MVTVLDDSMGAFMNDDLVDIFQIGTPLSIDLDREIGAELELETDVFSDPTGFYLDPIVGIPVPVGDDRNRVDTRVESLEAKAAFRNESRGATASGTVACYLSTVGVFLAFLGTLIHYIAFQQWQTSRSVIKIQERIVILGMPNGY